MKIVFLTIGLVAAITFGALGAVAAPLSARHFELVVDGKNDAVVPPTVAFPMGMRHVGTFTATSPFCPSGTFEDLTNDYLNSFGDTRAYTCTDGSGTIVTEQETWYEHKLPYTSTWRILGGTGRYANLRGKGSFVGGPPLTGGGDDDPLGDTYRCTFRGLVDFDSTAPTIAVSSVKTTKLRRPAGSYLLSLSLSLRDNVRGNVVAYEVAVDPGDGGLYLAQGKGSTGRGRVAMTLRIKPSRGARTVRLDLRAEDPVGNIRDATRTLKLPR